MENKYKAKIIGLSGSTIKDGATDYCVKQALEAAATIPGIETDFITLADEEFIHYCKGCHECLRDHKLCTIEDNWLPLAQRFMQGDGFIIGTPVHGMGCSAGLRAFFERFQCFLFFDAMDTLRGTVGGMLAVGGTRHGGQEMALLDLRNMQIASGMHITSGPLMNYSGACVWSNDKGVEGVKEDKIGMDKVIGLGKGVAQAALINVAGKMALQEAGVMLDEKWGSSGAQSLPDGVREMLEIKKAIYEK